MPFERYPDRPTLIDPRFIQERLKEGRLHTTRKNTARDVAKRAHETLEGNKNRRVNIRTEGLPGSGKTGLLKKILARLNPLDEHGQPPEKPIITLSSCMDSFLGHERGSELRTQLGNCDSEFFVTNFMRFDLAQTTYDAEATAILSGEAGEVIIPRAYNKVTGLFTDEIEKIPANVRVKLDEGVGAVSKLTPHPEFASITVFMLTDLFHAALNAVFRDVVNGKFDVSLFEAELDRRMGENLHIVKIIEPALQNADIVCYRFGTRSMLLEAQEDRDKKLHDEAAHRGEKPRITVAEILHTIPKDLALQITTPAGLCVPRGAL